MNSFQMKNRNVTFDSRKVKVVSCPFCWTDQRSSRNFCYACGAAFIFLDEAVGPSAGEVVRKSEHSSGFVDGNLLT